MIDYDNRLIFIHVPRTGGSSFVEAMGRSIHPDWRMEHLGWRALKSFYPDLWRQFRKVAVFRTEEDHRYSWYHYHRLWFANHLQPDNYAPYACTFKEWKRRGCPWHEDWTPCGIQGTPVNQWEFIGPPEEGVTVIPFEHMQERWADLVKSYGLPPSFADLPHINKGPIHEM